MLFTSLSCSRELPDGKVSYIAFGHKTEKINGKEVEQLRLTISSTIDLYAMEDSVGFANFFLRCPTDGDFKSYTKDSLFFLRDYCFSCDNVEVVEMNDYFLYTIPVRFRRTVDQNDIPFDTSELDSVLCQIDRCLECQIIFTQFLGKRRKTNIFCIPIDKLKRKTE